MHLVDVLARDSFTASFEFFPPKSASGWDSLFGTIADCGPLRPSFVSVTYGAGGSTRQNTHELVIRIRRETGLEAMPHLTCVNHTATEIDDILSEYARAGVSNILALRGDAPKEGGGARSAFAHAIDLVGAVRQFAKLGIHSDPRGFGVAVAGYPEGHPETPNTLTQMDHLKAKCDAGADLIISQLFFDNHAFLDWRQRCELAGIRTPILAGILPITSIAGMTRMAELAAGAIFPAALLRAIRRAGDDPEAVARVGIHWATEQCRELIDQGVRGIHFYTLNKSDATRKIYENLGVSSTDALRERTP
ncbi:MAG: methylenetetrahydrofolate reductase [NAD(P)H] [Phycisphaerales bacterium]|nr:methylenetetrahydrofolate reductase [NAD(P)H] [Phycisphaerales bacterium]